MGHGGVTGASDGTVAGHGGMSGNGSRHLHQVPQGRPQRVALLSKIEFTNRRNGLNQAFLAPTNKAVFKIGKLLRLLNIVLIKQVQTTKAGLPSGVGRCAVGGASSPPPPAAASAMSAGGIPVSRYSTARSGLLKLARRAAIT